MKKYHLVKKYDDPFLVEYGNVNWGEIRAFRSWESCYSYYRRIIHGMEEVIDYARLSRSNVVYFAFPDDNIVQPDCRYHCYKCNPYGCSMSLVVEKYYGIK